jgi:hypothetical protein
MDVSNTECVRNLRLQVKIMHVDNCLICFLCGNRLSGDSRNVCIILRNKL